jgi:hypothetical protein
MNYQVNKDGKHTFVECLPVGNRIANEQDALDWVAVCGEYGTDRLLLHAECLTADFFDLSTGVAGAILLKFVNYRLRVAAVIPFARSRQGKFGEMVIETNRGNQFRVFDDRDGAVAWLSGE